MKIKMEEKRGARFNLFSKIHAFYGIFGGEQNFSKFCSVKRAAQTKKCEEIEQFSFGCWKKQSLFFLVHKL